MTLPSQTACDHSSLFVFLLRCQSKGAKHFPLGRPTKGLSWQAVHACRKHQHPPAAASYHRCAASTCAAHDGDVRLHRALRFTSSSTELPWWHPLPGYHVRAPKKRTKLREGHDTGRSQFRSEEVLTMRTGLGGKIPHGRDESFFQNGRDWKCTVRGVGGVSGVNGVRLLRRLVHSSMYFLCNTAE